ncbi:hypothetical protein [Glutamicibacter sp. BW77]|uniref:Cell division protein FtsL n=1 Tax=Glutamicibacter bergerei TaxID=256702 RepID=A0ABV9MNF0_9MICC|nr:hypothetical protein [Glutamicibacter sp. BW77]PCC32268.1 hypothetical protein CIK74_15635 [Glutamicibacter sp. BW77]HBV10377.1 hypothetical protein [Micrococcaceae bacterium]
MTQRAQRRVTKTAAMTAQTVVDGSAARAVRPEPVAASELPEIDSRQRVTLSLVPRINETNKRSMLVMVIALVVVAFSVIVTLVLMNTSVAQRQYDIVSLRNQERVLSQENQALLKEAQSLSAPQALAKKAKALGLVAPGAPGLVDLNDNSITKSADKAVKAEGNSANYATLPLPGQSIRDKAKAETKKSESKAPVPTVGNTSKDDAKSATDSADSKNSTKSVVKDETTTRKVADDGRPVFKDSELNGGTIPAPMIKSPTN